jgi:hypothetical protein
VGDALRPQTDGNPPENLELKIALGPIIAVALLIVIGFQTSDAMRQSGNWRTKPTTRVRSVDPYAGLDAQLARQVASPLPATMRDPFGYGRIAEVNPRPIVHVKLAPPPAPRPDLTGVITDGAEVRAILRFEDRSYSVKTGDTFADFKVVNITAEQVVLDRKNGERIVLTRTPKGD